jgi:hypothetical protein
MLGIAKTSYACSEQGSAPSWYTYFLRHGVLVDSVNWDFVLPVCRWGLLVGASQWRYALVVALNVWQVFMGTFDVPKLGGIDIWLLGEHEKILILKFINFLITFVRDPNRSGRLLGE